MNRLAPAIVRVAVLVAVAGCAGVESRPHSVITTQPDGSRTFSVFREIDGNSVLCTLGAPLDHVVGTLQGHPDDPREPAWLEGLDGREISVIWPGGFTIRFEPEVTLVNDRGFVVAHAGAIVELTQTSIGDHAGTYDDPYLASGVLLGGCYPYID